MGRTCRDASAPKYESDSGKNPWSGSLRYGGYSKRYLLVRERFRPSYARLEAGWPEQCSHLQSDVITSSRQNRVSDYRGVDAHGYCHWISGIDWFGNCKAVRERGGTCCRNCQRHSCTILWRRSI